MRVRRSVSLLIVLAVGASACGSGYEQPDNPLGKALLQEAPEGYDKVDGPASGPMTLDVASTSSTAEPKEKKVLFKKHGYKGGYSRVWKNDTRYISVLVYQMRDEEAAKEVMIFEFEQLGDKKSAELFPLPQVPGGLGFKLTGIAGREYSNVDCKGVWFARSNRVFNVNTCGPKPPSEKQIADLASRQFALARKTTPVSKQSPEPTPGAETPTSTVPAEPAP
ncbi:MAG TPA: hypothetical protein VND22_06370 [Actinomycetota bacterium]|nr:hypothetical protein [Actinomycetota bacterium]